MKRVLELTAGWILIVVGVVMLLAASPVMLLIWLMCRDPDKPVKGEENE